MVDPARADPPVMRYMIDDYGSEIESIQPERSIEETVDGRIAGLDADIRQVYTEINDLLAGSVVGITPEEYETRLSDLVELLVDLGKRTDRAFDLSFARRWGW